MDATSEKTAQNQIASGAAPLDRTSAAPASQAGAGVRSEPGSTNGIMIAVVLARLILAIVFLYMGVHKVLHPVEFLKLVKQYELITAPPWLNLIAAMLPWFEVL